MTKCKKFAERSRDYGQEFFALRGKKASVPSGCVFAGIRFVAALAGSYRYPLRASPCGLLRENGNAMDQ